MKKILLASAMALVLGTSFGAQAHDSYGASAKASLTIGTVAAQSSSSTVGGSSFGVDVNSNGSAKGYANSAGGGTATAGGNVTKNGVTTFTDNTAYSSGDAKSHISGSATGSGSAAQGTDTSATAVGNFGKISGFGSLALKGL